MASAPRLEGKVAIVTGAGSRAEGIGNGRAAAVLFACEGARVLLVDREPEVAEATLAMIQDEDGEAAVFQADVTASEDCHAMVADAVTRWGRLDILHNNVGIGGRGSVVEMDVEDWERIMQVNVTGMMLASKHAIPAIKESGGGAIVNISSLAGIVGSGSSIAYAASKGALITLTQSLARAFAPEVRVNALAPGVILTRWVEGNEEFVQQYIDATAVKKACPPESIAHAVIFLIESEVITGQTVVMDGGLTLG